MAAAPPPPQAAPGKKPTMFAPRPARFPHKTLHPTQTATEHVAPKELGAEIMQTNMLPFQRGENLGKLIQELSNSN